MNNVNKTLYIPLYGKAFVSRRGILLADPKAEEIWGGSAFPLRGKSASKWLAYTMAMRAAVFDNWLKAQLTPDAVVLHLGCGLDSRCLRVACDNTWFDVDFPDVISQRREYFAESDRYRMIGCDLREDFLAGIPEGKVIVVLEGVSMYLTAQERRELLAKLKRHFSQVRILLDSYTVFGARMSKYKNPVNDVGVTQVYGFDDPRDLEEGTGFTFLQEHDMTPEAMIAQLSRMEQRIFRRLFAGKTAKRFYRMYEYL